MCDFIDTCGDNSDEDVCTCMNNVTNCVDGFVIFEKGTKVLQRQLRNYLKICWSQKFVF